MVSERWSWLFLCLLLVPATGEGLGGVSHAEEIGSGRTTAVTNSDKEEVEGAVTDDARNVEEIALIQPAPFVLPTPQFQAETPLPSAAAELGYSLFGLGGLERSLLRQTRLGNRPIITTDYVLGREAGARVTTDAGSLLRKSPSALGVRVQQRTPIVNDPRIRGSRVGALGASGSYWVPARIDLDTAVSKIDSRIIEDAIVILGPYSVFYGPGFSFVDVEMLRSPRFESYSGIHGTTGVDFNTNGDQWFGHQNMWGGADNWGVRASYGHRTGNDYFSGNGTQFGASYNSREFNIALGMDLSDDRSVEFNYLRLDQTGVEFPGYAFDMDFLVTDGFDVDYVVEDGSWYDRFAVEAWYNRTNFAGNAQSPNKRVQFPFLDLIRYVGFTDVDSMSTGFSAGASWGCPCCSFWVAGVDMRFVKQELNEISSGVGLGLPLPFTNRNSPIPRSFIVNPGMFLAHSRPVHERLDVTIGARFDIASSDITDSPAKLAGVGLDTPQATYAEVVGTNEFQTDFALWSLHGTAAYKVNSCWTIASSVGYAERPPTLTELYAAGSFMFLLQNGLNTVTGDPELDQERLLQVDLGVDYEGNVARAGLRGFCAFAWDYITYEALSVRPTPAAVEQINLKYVNTDRATLAGGEAYLEVDSNSWFTPFATLKYVAGRDQTRDGNFATTQGFSGVPSTQVPGLPRGFFSGIPGSAREPLPGIPPLESRVGIRLHEVANQRQWEIELSVRIVDNQDRIATSLLESPTPGFTVFDIRGRWQPRERLHLVAGVENLTDRNYREHFDLRAQNGISVFRPGVNFYFGTELTY